MDEFSRSSHIQKRGSSVRSLCLENSPWRIALPVPFPASASPHSSRPTSKGGVFQWRLAKRVVTPQFVANILFSGEAGFTGDSAVNFHSQGGWQSPHHRGIKTSRLAGAVFYCFWWTIYQHSWSMCLFINDTYGSCKTGHHLFSPQRQTAPEPDLRWTVDRTRRLSRLTCTILWP
jgi:hypothetical protein